MFANLVLLVGYNLFLSPPQSKIEGKIILLFAIQLSKATVFANTRLLINQLFPILEWNTTQASARGVQPSMPHSIALPKLFQHPLLCAATNKINISLIQLIKATNLIALFCDNHSAHKIKGRRYQETSYHCLSECTYHESVNFGTRLIGWLFGSHGLETSSYRLSRV